MLMPLLLIIRPTEVIETCWSVFFVHVVFWVDLLVQRRLCLIFVKLWVPERDTIYYFFSLRNIRTSFF